MSSKNRRSYLTETALTQDVLDACADNLECRLELVVEIETPDGVIYASDRNKYVGGRFYEALLTFPVIGRTVGEWLSPDIQFSSVTIELSNVDGRFNRYLPSGAAYGGWIGKHLTVKLGLAEVASSYTAIFAGQITDIAGFKRSTKSITFIARDKYDIINLNFPTITISKAAYPKCKVDDIGKLIPVIYGDWTVGNEPAPAGIPSTNINANDPLVAFKDKDFTVDPGTDTLTSINHSFDNDDLAQVVSEGTLPTPLSDGTDYYIVNKTDDTFQLSLTMGGSPIDILDVGIGSNRIVASPSALRRNVQLLLAINDLSFIDTGGVYLKRGSLYHLVPPSEVTNIGAGNRGFEVKQNTLVLWVDPADGNPLTAYLFDDSDVFYTRLRGKDLAGYDDNPLWQARDLLKTYGTLVDADFDASWVTYRDKSSPPQSAIASIKSRVWLQEQQTILVYALQILEQVRLEAFIDRDLKLKINSLHFEDWVAAPTMPMRNWDVEKDSFKANLDDRNNFNRAQAFYNFQPDTNENSRKTAIYHNAAAISQAGKKISKQIQFPNLYVEADVINQLTEILRLASSYLETVDVNLTWRFLLKDIGEFVRIDVKIGSSIFENVPAMVRDIGYDPQGVKIPMKLWSMMMVPFPGWTPGYPGTVGGYAATIDAE